MTGESFLLIFIILIIFIFYLLIVISIFFSPTSIKSIINGAAPIPTPKKDIRLALESVGLSDKDVFYDLGSCTGKVVIIAEKEFGADTYGLEWSPFWFLFSKINLFLHKSKSKIHRTNFLEVDLSKSNIIYCYTSKPLMKKIENKFLNERIEAKLVSYCFPFPNLKAKKIIKTNKGKNIFIYENHSN